LDRYLDFDEDEDRFYVGMVTSKDVDDEGRVKVDYMQRYEKYDPSSGEDRYWIWPEERKIRHVSGKSLIQTITMKLVGKLGPKSRAMFELKNYEAIIKSANDKWKIMRADQIFPSQIETPNKVGTASKVDNRESDQSITKDNDEIEDEQNSESMSIADEIDFNDVCDVTFGSEESKNDSLTVEKDKQGRTKIEGNTEELVTEVDVNNEYDPYEDDLDELSEEDLKTNIPLEKSIPSEVKPPKLATKNHFESHSITAPNIVEELSGGWKRERALRKTGGSAGHRDIYVYSPKGKKFRSRKQLVEYLDENPDIEIDINELWPLQSRSRVQRKTPQTSSFHKVLPTPSTSSPETSNSPSIKREASTPSLETSKTLSTKRESSTSEAKMEDSLPLV